jgi:hypothetical protein
MYSRFVHILSCTSLIPFYGQIILHCIAISMCLSIYQLMNISESSCFHSLATNNLAINIPAQVLQGHMFLAFLGTYGISIH